MEKKMTGADMETRFNPQAIEADLYKARTALPLTYEKVYVVSDDDIYDHWYDPCTDTFFLKYMKGKA